MEPVICRGIRGERREVAVEELVWRPSVYGVAIRGDRVLLVPQWDGYDFPGGGMEIGETIDEALVREFREETGLMAERGEVLACESDFFIHPGDQKPYHTVVMYYLCKSVSGEISDAYFDTYEKTYAKKAEWVAIGRIKDLKFYNPVDSAAIIQKAFEIASKRLEVTDV